MATNYNLEHGLMPQIQALINPVPCSIDLSHTTRLDYRYQFYLRTQARGANHDMCDACDESGDLVCCDSCPAAFHLACTDSPLSEEDIDKMSTWSCKRCTYSKTPRSMTKPGDQSDDGESPLKSIFNQLITQAEKTNPKEFKLPIEFGCIEPALPGASRLVYKKSCPARSKQTIIEMDNFIVPRPVVKCYDCGKSCRIGPLIQCDLCPSFYHLDCMTPPLTVPPTSIWQCPLHPEPSMESKLLKSTLLSERVRLWDFTTQIPYGYDIKREFIRKVKKSFYGSRSHRAQAQPHDGLEIEIPQTIADSYAFKPSNPNAGEKWTEGRIEENHCQVVETEWMSTAKSGERELVPRAHLEPTITIDSNPLLSLADAASALQKIDEFIQKPGSDLNKAIDQLDLNTIKFLAAQRLKGLDEENASAAREEAILIQEKENNPSTNAIPSPTRLVLHCLTNGRNFRFSKNSVEIGLGSQVDVNLVDSQCKNISKRHATIHHDPVTNKWELLCYSTYGTMVNNCLYGCNQYQHPNGNGDMDARAKDLFAQVVRRRKAAILDQAHASTSTSTSTSPKLKVKVKANSVLVKDCECSKSGIWNGPTCEDSVEIKQHDLLQFGCLKFIVLSAILNEVE